MVARTFELPPTEALALRDRVLGARGCELCRTRLVGTVLTVEFCPRHWRAVVASQQADEGEGG